MVKKSSEYTPAPGTTTHTGETPDAHVTVSNDMSTESLHHAIHSMLDGFAPEIADRLVAAVKAKPDMWDMLKQQQRPLFAEHKSDDEDKYAVGFLAATQLVAALVSHASGYAKASVLEGAKGMPEEVQGAAYLSSFNHIIAMGALAQAMLDAADRFYKISSKGSPDAQARHKEARALVSIALHREGMELAERIAALTTVPEGATVN